MSTYHRSLAASRTYVERAESGAESVRTEVIASTSMEGRDGDVWEQDWILDHYLRNPVVLDSHESWGTGRVVGRSVEVGVVEHPQYGRVLRALIEWDTGEHNPDGRRIAAQFQGGFLSAVSVGMRPGAMVPRSSLPDEHPAKGERGYYMTRNELLEISAVAIPADPRAVAQRDAAAAERRAEVRAEVLRLIRGDAEVRRALSALPLTQPTADSGTGLDWFDTLPEIVDDLAELFTFNDSNGSTP